MAFRFLKQLKSRNQEFRALIENLDISENHKFYLKSRWLNLLSWMDSSAMWYKFFHYAARLLMVIGGVLIPSLISANNPKYRIYTFVASLVVGICTAINEVFKFKDHWYHYRLNAELLRTEGFYFLLLTGTYQKFNSHQDAFLVFATKVESIAQAGLQSFLVNIIKEKEDKLKLDSTSGEK